ncbi:transposase [Streptomyces sp. NBC_00316]|uniref:transposase n=1 Tax=Streptomyces sp. NBC_00316 TaxID=2975710 RepID=UPI003FA7A532
MFEAFTRADQHRWGQAYVRGLLLDGRRKSVEPMAARLGEDGNRQVLAHCVTSSPWSWGPGAGPAGMVALRIRPAGREIRDATPSVEPAACWLPAEWPAKESSGSPACPPTPR